MPFEIHTEADLTNFASRMPHPTQTSPPQVLTVADLLALDLPEPSMLVENTLPAAGATLMFGAPKSNKTLFAVQIAIAVASGSAVCDYYRVLHPGAVLVVEQDDPAGAASIKDILRRSPVGVANIPFSLAPRVPHTFGLEFLDWLEGQIRSRGLRLIVLETRAATEGTTGKRAVGCIWRSPFSGRLPPDRPNHPCSQCIAPPKN